MFAAICFFLEFRGTNRGKTLTEPGPDEYQGTTIKPGSNEHYYKTLLMYQGLLTEEEIVDEERLGGQWPTVAWGVPVWHLVRRGHRARFGYVAAEADLIRLGAVEN